MDWRREDAFDTVKAVPEAVSIWAIIFPAPWLIWHGLWVELGFYLLALVLIAGLFATPYAPAALLLSGLPGLYLWLEGHNLRRGKLTRKGYQMVDVVQAVDEKTAFARFIDKQIKGQDDTIIRLEEMGFPSARPSA